MSPTPQRLRRADAFLGIHFDFHCGSADLEVGRHVTARMVGDIVRLVRPDYIQCDGKGHPGISSYPTRVGHRPARFVRDALRVWRRETARQGVALFMHYSGVWDNAAVRHHPSWARRGPDGSIDREKASVFGPYVDRLMIPQLKELCDDYGVDGVWVDGDCWAAMPDFGRDVLRRFREETGIRAVPRDPADPRGRRFAEFCREGFRRYLRRYVDALHGHNPRFQVASNWAFSSMMPEPVSADVDFLSGDYSLQDSVNSARLEGRCLMGQGKPWDLMAWSFAQKWGEKPVAWSTKTVPQLCQEAAVVVALGGGFQAYFRQKRDASIYPWTMKLMRDVARFCRARQPYCHRATPIPQVGLIYSRQAFVRRTRRLFSPWDGELTPLRGVLNALLENQRPVEILMDHHLAARGGEYPLLVWPEWEHVSAGMRRWLTSYVEGGGCLLVIGAATVQRFSRELGLKPTGKPTVRGRFLEHGGWLCGIGTRALRAIPRRGTRVLAWSYAGDEVSADREPAAVMRRRGKGRIAGVCLDLGERYLNGRTSVCRDLVGAVVRELMPAPLVEVTGSRSVDVSVMGKSGCLVVNLVNTRGPHADKNVYQWDELPPVGPLAVTVRLSRRPRSVTLQPGNRRLRWTWRDGVVRCTIRRLAIHDVLVVAPA